MTDKRMIKAIDGHSELAKQILPKQDNRIKITYFGIFAETNYYPYTESITTINGNVSGGGTRTGSYETYDFGFGVENLSNASMRVQFAIKRKDSEGYSVDDAYTCIDINPGEKKRAWSNFRVRNLREFKLYTLTDIGIGPVPRNPRDFATWSAASSPQKSIYELLDLESDWRKANSVHPAYLWASLAACAAIAAFIYFARH